MPLQKAVNHGSYNYLYVRELITGDLMIAISEADRAVINEELLDNEYEYDPTFDEFIEPMLCNGFDWIMPEQIGALTDAPIIGIIDGDLYGNEEPVNWDTSKVWWYPNYQIRNPMDDLAELGYVILSASES